MVDESFAGVSITAESAVGMVLMRPLAATPEFFEWRHFLHYLDTCHEYTQIATSAPIFAYLLVL